MTSDPKLSTTPTSHYAEDWRELAEQASKEQDPRKLLKIIAQLCENLEHREAALRNRPKT